MSAQRRFGKGQVNYVALGETSTTAMRNVLHQPETLDASGIIASSECEQRFAERRRECFLR